ncbi:MAG: PKD domain-containing protein [Bacteroidia bacterium]
MRLRQLTLGVLSLSLYAQEVRCGYVNIRAGDVNGLRTAIANAAAGAPRFIRLEIGEYPLTAPLSLENNVVIEGGFDFSDPNNPVKRSGGISRLKRLSGTPEANPCRLVAVQAINKSGFELHDLYIEVENARYNEDGPGCSTYGLYLNGCSNYQIVRCRIHAGNATDGKPGDPVRDGRDGANGAKGEDGCRRCDPINADPNNEGGAGGSSWSGGAQAGGRGGNGGPVGSGRSGCFFPDLDQFCRPPASALPGQSGQNGNTAVGGQAPALGGRGGRELNVCRQLDAAFDFITFLSGCPAGGFAYGGEDGENGRNGRDGADGSPGVRSFSPTGWFLPGDGQDGQPGEHGGGGGGGGGGGALGGIPEQLCFINIGRANSSGGGGGGGGEGGEGGPGGKGGGGGGGAFAVFLWNNGPNGFLRDCPLTVGQPGRGALGSPGGRGGRGGKGGCGGGFSGDPCQRFCGPIPPQNECAAGCEGGYGGRGGDGGNGGNGGRGGNGADGLAQTLYQSLAGQPVTTTNSFVPTEPPIAIQNPICTHSAITFSVENADPLTRYEWGFGANATPIFASGPTATTFFTTAEFHTILLRVNDIPYRYTLFASPLQPGVVPDIQPSGNLPVCEGASATFQANLTNPANRTIQNYEWRLTGPGGFSHTHSGATANTYTTPPLNALGTYKVYLRVRSECCGLSLWDSLEFEVVPSRLMTAQLIANPPEVCEGQPVTLTVVGGNLGLTPTYTWYRRRGGARAVIPGATGSTYTDPAPQSGDQYEVEVTSSLACISNSPLTTNAATVTVHPRPQLSCSSPLRAYLGLPVSFTINASNSAQLQPPFSYQIDLGNGFTVSGQSNTFPIRASANYGGAGTYRARVTVTDARGCQSSCDVEVQLVAEPPPQVDFSGTPQEGCEELTATFTATPAADEYRWSFGDGSSPQTTAQNPIQHTYNQPGFYTVKLEARFGGTWVTVEKIHYIRVYHRPNPQIAVISPPCANQPIQFSDVGTDGYSWEWDFGDGGRSTAAGPQHTYAASGTYTVTLTAWSHNRVCSATTQRQITVQRRPTARLNVDPTSGCAPFTLRPTNSSDPAGAAGVIYIWVWGDGTRDTLRSADSPTHTYSTAGTYTLQLIALSQDGCSDTARTAVRVLPTPQASFSPTNVQRRIPDTQVEFTNQSQGAVRYEWDFGNGQTSTAVNPGPVNFPREGTYNVTLIAYSAEGCADTARGVVVIEPGLEIFIPNVFTPNGDGINDLWLIRATMPYEVWVYDRWGIQVFYGNNAQLWDGRCGGTPCPEGVYTYRLLARVGGTHEFMRAGTVTLLR